MNKPEKPKRRRWRCGNCGRTKHRTGLRDEPPEGWRAYKRPNGHAVYCDVCFDTLTRG